MALLDAELADLVDALVLPLVELAVVGFADAADITDQMAGLRTHRIIAGETGGDVHALEGETVDLEARDILWREVGLECHATVARGLAGAILEASDIARRQSHHRPQRGQQGVEVLDLIASDFEVERGPVLRQQRTVAVVDQPAHRRHGDHAHAVVVGAGAVVLMLQQLQVAKPRHQQADHQEAEQDGDDDAPLKAALLLVEVLERIEAV